MYAIVETGGKQYRVAPGDTVKIEKLPVAQGSTVELDRVLLVAGDEGVKIGSPTLPGAKVVAQVVEQGKGEKIIVFNYKSKVRYRRKRGHRQLFTRLAIQEIVTG